MAASLIPYSIYVDVAVALPVHQTYIYGVLPQMDKRISPGCSVLVPFGKRRVTGYVQSLLKTTKQPDIKAVIKMLDDTPLYPEEMIPFFQWIADYYLHPIGLVIKTALPTGLNLSEYKEIGLTNKGRSALTRPDISKPVRDILETLDVKSLKYHRLKANLKFPHAEETLATVKRRGWVVIKRRLSSPETRIKTERIVRLVSAEIGPFTKPRKKIIEALTKKNDQSLARLKELVPTATTIVRKMAAAGSVTIGSQPVYRDPFGDTVRPDKPPPLTPDQQQVVKSVTHGLKKGFATYLLAGVTGSGKTEVYLTLVQRVIQTGGQALVLVPEIALISQVERRFRARFGERVAVLHSSLSAGERYDQWRRIIDNQTPVVIGARSAVFAPIQRLQLIIVDEEHDSAFKQETGLRYQARDLAIVRAKLCKAPILLGSATPSVQSIYNTDRGKYQPLVLSRRINQRTLPVVDIVDLRKTGAAKGPLKVISPPLHQAMRESLQRGEQVLLFLNRRGFAGNPICMACGKPVRCRHCDITLTLHQAHRAYKCHYCGFTRPSTISCTACGANTIHALGMGTEKIETIANTLFPKARISRMDRDTTKGKHAAKRILKALKERHIDILVGTQMIAKGHDFPNITLVGIICADLSLDFPDFRAGERTFQLLAQVAGRAGRGKSPGRVVLQTYNPDHFTIQAAQSHDFRSFYQREIQFRQALGYPPYSFLAQFTIAGKDRVGTQEKAVGLGRACRTMVSAQNNFSKSIGVLGPVEAPLARISDRYRWHILLKAPTSRLLHLYLRSLYNNPPLNKNDRKVKITIDIDPYLMM